MNKKTVQEVFRVDAQGDTLYVAAYTLVEAKLILRRHMGAIPDSLLAWSGPMKLPPGEEAIR